MVPWSVPSFWACPVCAVQHCCVRTLVSDTNHREYCWLSCPNGTQAHSIFWPPLQATHAHVSNHVVVSSRVAALCALGCIIFMCGRVHLNHQVNTCPVDENAHIFVFRGVWSPSLAAIFVNDTRRVRTCDLTFASLMRSITSHVQCGLILRCRSAVPTTSVHFCIARIWASVSTKIFLVLPAVATGVQRLVL